MVRCADTSDMGIPRLQKSTNGTAATSLPRQTVYWLFWSITSSLATAPSNILTTTTTHAKLVCHWRKRLLAQGGRQCCNQGATQDSLHCTAHAPGGSGHPCR